MDQETALLYRDLAPRLHAVLHRRLARMNLSRPDRPRTVTPRWVRTTLAERDLPGDALHDAFVTYLQHRAARTPVLCPAAFVTTLAVRTLQHTARREAARLSRVVAGSSDDEEDTGASALDEVPASGPDPESHLSTCRELALAVERLGPLGADDHALLLAQAEEVPFATLALDLGRSAGALRVRLHTLRGRAREPLRAA